jgi:hypothetical protein
MSGRTFTDEELADATRELVEALERIANVTDNWADNLASQVNEIARAALEKAKRVATPSAACALAGRGTEQQPQSRAR